MQDSRLEIRAIRPDQRVNLGIDPDPLNYTDPFGLCPIPILCEAIDIGFVIADLNDIRQNGLTWGSGFSLAADVAATAIPVLPAGSGALYRAGRGGARYLDDFVTKNTKYFSGMLKSEGDARALARRRIGHNPVEVSPGKWRSRDGKWQYRAKPGDVADGHVHIEELNPRTGEVLQNWHLRWENPR